MRQKRCHVLYEEILVKAVWPEQVQGGGETPTFEKILKKWKGSIKEKETGRSGIRG